MSTRRIGVRKQGLIVKILIVECYNSYNKVFEAEANTNNKSQVNDLILSAHYKGLPLPPDMVASLTKDYDSKTYVKKKDRGAWWPQEK